MELGGEIHAPAALYWGEEPRELIAWEAGWAAEPVWMWWPKSVNLPGIEPDSFTA
jgi:hypothetical protein